MRGDKLNVTKKKRNGKIRNCKYIVRKARKFRCNSLIPSFSIWRTLHNFFFFSFPSFFFFFFFFSSSSFSFYSSSSFFFFLIFIIFFSFSFSSSSSSSFFFLSATTYIRFWLAQPLSSKYLYSVLISSNCLFLCSLYLPKLHIPNVF